jgi:hypothetical protein
MPPRIVRVAASSPTPELTMMMIERAERPVDIEVLLDEQAPDRVKNAATWRIGGSTSRRTESGATSIRGTRGIAPESQAADQEEHRVQRAESAGEPHQGRDDDEERKEDSAVCTVDLRCCQPVVTRASTAGTSEAGNSRTGKPSSTQRARPPSSGRTRVIPRRLSWSATRALVASFGQVQ